MHWCNGIESLLLLKNLGNTLFFYSFIHLCIEDSNGKCLAIEKKLNEGSKCIYGCKEKAKQNSCNSIFIHQNVYNLYSVQCTVLVAFIFLENIF